MANINDMMEERERKKQIKVDKNGIKRMETDKELDKRLEQESIDRFYHRIKEIMKHGFTAEQAEYLITLEDAIESARKTYFPRRY